MVGWGNPCPDFPTVARLWRGVVLGTIAEVVVGSGESRGWDGPTFVIDPMSGDHGAVTFSGDRVVGLFFDHNSDRNPFPPGRPPYDIRPYFVGMLADLYALASEHTLRVMEAKALTGYAPSSPPPSGVLGSLSPRRNRGPTCGGTAYRFSDTN